MSAKKKKIIRWIITFICVVSIILGIAVVSYPVFMKMYVENKQENMIEDIEKLMEENARKRQAGEIEDNTLPSDKDSDVNTQKGDMVTKQFEELTLTQKEDEDYSVTKEDILESQDVIGIIKADSIGIRFAVVEGAGRWNIAYAIGHMTGTAGIGEKGNCVLAGHRGGVYGEFFKHIDQLNNGDKVSLKNIYGDEYIYTVYDKFIVEPDAMWITEAVKEHERVLTMLSCENSGKQRIIVRAYLE